MVSVYATALEIENRVDALMDENATLRAQLETVTREWDEAIRRGEDQWAGWVREEVARKSAESALTAAQKRIEDLEKALKGVRPYLVDDLDAHEHSDGRELLGSIDALLSKQGGE